MIDLPPFVYDAKCPKCKRRNVSEFGFRYCMSCGATMRPLRKSKSGKIGSVGGPRD